MVEISVGGGGELQGSEADVVQGLVIDTDYEGNATQRLKSA